MEKNLQAFVYPATIGSSMEVCFAYCKEDAVRRFRETHIAELQPLSDQWDKQIEGSNFPFKNHYKEKIAFINSDGFEKMICDGVIPDDLMILTSEIR